MTLPFELTTMPEQALDILRYMGRVQLDRIHADDLISGLGMSKISFNKGIRRLVTKNYMAMDESRYYRVTQKGFHAIEDISGYDAVGPTRTDVQIATLAYDLCAVIPQGLSLNQTNRFLVGLEPDPMEMEVLNEIAHLLVRVSVEGGQISPVEATLRLSSERPAQFVEMNLTPNQPSLRVRVEAIQLMEINDPYESGGMYFDVEVGGPSQPRALHTAISVAQT